MYAYIRGPLVSITSHFAIIDACGVGYKIHIPVNIAAKLFECKQEVKLHTSFIVREGFQGLFGFLEEQEKELFEMLIEISGIGPKIALSLMGAVSLEDLHTIVAEEDAEALSKVPGIGKKSAERILVELKNKLGTFFKKGQTITSRPKEIPIYQDALKALVHLGYKHAVAQKALKKAMQDEKSMSLNALISCALKHV
jgi:holliday junction DNA helicase RuvA